MPTCLSSTLKMEAAVFAEILTPSYKTTDILSHKPVISTLTKMNISSDTGL